MSMIDELAKALCSTDLQNQIATKHDLEQSLAALERRLLIKIGFMSAVLVVIMIVILKALL
jgi:hypothetical protein